MSDLDVGSPAFLPSIFQATPHLFSYVVLSASTHPLNPHYARQWGWEWLFNSWHSCRNPGIIFFKTALPGTSPPVYFPHISAWILNIRPRFFCLFVCFALLMHIANFKYCFFNSFLINKQSRPVNNKMHSIFLPRKTESKYTDVKKSLGKHSRYTHFWDMKKDIRLQVLTFSAAAAHWGGGTG